MSKVTFLTTNNQRSWNILRYWIVWYSLTGQTVIISPTVISSTVVRLTVIDTIIDSPTVLSSTRQWFFDSHGTTIISPLSFVRHSMGKETYSVFRKKESDSDVYNSKGQWQCIWQFVEMSTSKDMRLTKVYDM